MDKCRERKYFYFRRQFSYVTGKNTDKYKAEVNESRQKTALDQTKNDKQTGEVCINAI